MYISNKGFGINERKVKWKKKSPPPVALQNVSDIRSSVVHNYCVRTVDRFDTVPETVISARIKTFRWRPNSE
jgi:hypothetical protein